MDLGARPAAIRDELSQLLRGWTSDSCGENRNREANAYAKLSKCSDRATINPDVDRSQADFTLLIHFSFHWLMSFVA